MPEASVYYDCLSAVKVMIDGLALSGASTAIRMLPKAEETIDTLPLIAIAPGDPERVTQETFEDESGVNVVYSVDVVTIAASNRDFVTNLDRYLNWRQQVRRLFQSNELTGQLVGGKVWKIEIEPDPAFDRAALNRNYVYSGMTLRIHVVEQRTNNG